MAALYLSKNRQTLHDGTRRFDPVTRTWSPFDVADVRGDPVAPADAVQWLYQKTAAAKVPVGVIGPREATPDQLRVAEALGARIGALGIPLLNGGKNGVMEAVSKGCAEVGGMVIGLLPDDSWTVANPYVTVPIATGLGKARNVLIAQSCLALVAVGGEYGTLSEMAFGLHFDKPVFTLEGAPNVDGVYPRDSVDSVMNDLVNVVLGLPMTS